MTDKIEIVVPGTSVPFTRTGGRGKGRFTQSKHRQAMAVLVLIARDIMGARPPLTGPVEFELHATYLRPASWSKKKARTVWKASRPDGGNLQKLAEDALNKIVYVDDAQITSWGGSKRYADREELRIIVRPLPDEA